MKIIVTTPGRYDDEAVVWPPGWPLPRENDQVTLRDETPLFVRRVEWVPQGSEEMDDHTPYVYIVLGASPIY